MVGCVEFSGSDKPGLPKTIMGYIRGEGQLKYATVLRTGHENFTWFQVYSVPSRARNAHKDG